MMRLTILSSVFFAFANPVSYADNDTGAVTVQAGMKTGDSIHTCAGEFTYVIGVSSRSTKKIKQIYGNDQSGAANIYETIELILKREGQRFRDRESTQNLKLFRKSFRNTRKTRCSENGVATFENLKPGEYFIIAPVFWKNTDKPAAPRVARLDSRSTRAEYVVPTNYEGGTIMARVMIEAGDHDSHRLLVDGGSSE
ncbi:MAG: hypothetical protein AAGF20_03900 [Pseudomonadota bacterium]